MNARNIGQCPAFPVPIEADHWGMNYRMWLVGMALQGLLANAASQLDFELAAEEAIGHADSVLAQLENTK